VYTPENKPEQTGTGKWSVENKNLVLVQDGDVTKSEITYLDNKRLVLDDGTTLVLTFRRIQPNDRDGDGVLDVVDNCPNEKGTAENAGCPEEKAQRSGPRLIAAAINALTKEPLYGVRYTLAVAGEKPFATGYDTDKGIITFGVDGKGIATYQVVAEKNGFLPDTVAFNTLSGRRDTVFRVTPALRPIEVSDPMYLPVVLYFDNDQPDPSTNAITTDKEYRSVYVDYLRRKDEYIKQYTTGLDEAQRYTARDALETFFERDVRGGWERLFVMSEGLYAMLEQGAKIELTLRGYTSSRGASTYNLNLSKRRISSVINHFLNFDGGLYKKFVDNGQLTFKPEPNGESKAPANVSDNEKDPRRSVYSPEAARENRVEIIGVKFNK
jgi:hypothetical protein